MESQVALTYPRREIDGADKQRKHARKRMGDEETAVGDDLQTVGVVHGIIGDEQNF
jgi:hypothetical protein